MEVTTLKKKLMTLGIALLSLFPIAGLVACGEDKPTGTLYSLQEAYEQELLTVADLRNIAFYFNEELNDENYTSTPKNPAVLSKEVENNIKQKYRFDFEIPKNSIGLISIWSYFGTYNDCIAIGITDSYYAYDYVIIAEYAIAGVVFKNFHTASIRIWSENN